jgi:hypothetical protein
MADRYRDRPFPTDDHSRGYSDVPRGSESDPLAELARLIGQTDPFSNFSRDRAQSDQGHDDYDAHNDDYNRNNDYNRNDHNDDYSRNDHYERDYDEAPLSTPPWVQRQAEAGSGYNGSGANGSGVNGRGYNGRSQDSQRFDAPPFDDGYQSRGDGRMPAPSNARRAPVDRGPVDNDRYDDLLFGEPERRPEPRQSRDTRFEERPFGNDFEQEIDEAPPRRGGLTTVIVVLALAILGTAGAYAYRSFMGSPRSGEPPVFRADAGPNKIIPPSQSGDKQSYDRVGDKPAERVVSREEQPLDIDSSKNSPRVVFPQLTPNPNPPTSASSTTTRQAGTGNGTLNGEEPRKIKTLTIRPDQPDTAAAASIGSNSAPVSPPPVRSAATPRAVTPAASAVPSAPAAGNAPMSLTPQIQTQTPSSRVASINPAQQTSSGGGSFVQVSSQKTEADAQASFKALQTKYSGILGSRTSSIRRADLGDKGVFYRAMVGPFASTDEATQFCVNLKSAGGQCIVQRN